MLFLVISLILLLGNWILSSILVFIPIQIVNYLGSVSWTVFLLIVLGFLGWCFGDNTISHDE